MLLKAGEMELVTHANLARNTLIAASAAALLIRERGSVTPKVRNAIGRVGFYDDPFLRAAVVLSPAHRQQIARAYQHTNRALPRTLRPTPMMDDLDRLDRSLQGPLAEAGRLWILDDDPERPYRDAKHIALALASMDKPTQMIIREDPSTAAVLRHLFSKSRTAQRVVKDSPALQNALFDPRGLPATNLRMVQPVLDMVNQPLRWIHISGGSELEVLISSAKRPLSKDSLQYRRPTPERGRDIPLEIDLPLSSGGGGLLDGLGDLLNL